MELLTVSVGLPREVSWRGRTVRTGIFKSPVNGRVRLATLNLDGDGQADLSVHGGVTKAVYVYPAEHYDFWRGQHVAEDLPHASFGENFTTSGLLEDAVYIGDRFRVGSAEVMVTEPRMPCYKLGIKFGDARIIKRFADSGRTGFYFSVLREGEVGAGDSIERLSLDDNRVSVADVVRLHFDEKPDRELMERAALLPALPLSWRDYFRGKAAELE